MQTRLMLQDEIDAINYWKGKEGKKWAVDITTGPAKRSTTRTYYAYARAAERAIICTKANLPVRVPRNARIIARLAGPRELGCVPTPGFPPDNPHGSAEQSFVNRPYRPC